MDFITQLTAQPSDKTLSERAQNAMSQHEYDTAINNVRRMKNTRIATEMELLIIEHEQLHLNQLKS